jgi:hypothetical protein
MRAGSSVILAAVLCIGLSANASAQPNRQYWGVEASVAPSWEVKDSFKKLFDADAIDLSGSEFRIGFVRGQTLEGDWGVSYVRQSVKDGARITTSTVDRTAANVAVNGVRVNKFAPFGTIKDRVQLGMAIGIGVGSATGTVTERNLRTGISTVVEAKHFFAPFGADIPVVPLGNLEFAVAVIGGPGFKVKASGGFNYPGTSVFTIGAVYLFGEK